MVLGACWAVVAPTFVRQKSARPLPQQRCFCFCKTGAGMMCVQFVLLHSPSSSDMTLLLLYPETVRGARNNAGRRPNVVCTRSGIDKTCRCPKRTALLTNGPNGSNKRRADEKPRWKLCRQAQRQTTRRYMGCTTGLLHPSSLMCCFISSHFGVVVCRLYVCLWSRHACTHTYLVWGMPPQRQANPEHSKQKTARMYAVPPQTKIRRTKQKEGHTQQQLHCYQGQILDSR